MKSSEFTIRKATADDVPFLVDTIIEAEKSGTSVLSYSTIFGLSETDARKYIANMLLEEVDGCELSISAFLLAERGGRIAGAVGAWIEGFEGVPSSMLKGNLLNYALPKSCMEKAFALNNLVKDLHIEYKDNSIQIGLVYVDADFRGLGLANLLIEEQLEQLQDLSPAISESFVQVFGNNKTAIRSYEKSGYAVILEKKSTNPRMSEYFPAESKVLMKRDLK